MRTTRRVLSVAGALCLVATGCVDGGSSSDTTPIGATGCGLDALARETDAVEVTVWHFYTGIGSGAAGRAFAELVDGFNRSQQQVRVTLKGFDSPEELIRRYFATPPGGEGAPDLVHLPPRASRAAADTGRVIPVQACLDAAGTDVSDFVPSALASTHSEGTQWGLPDGHAGDLLLYDSAAFTRAGLDPDRPPATLAELRHAAEALLAAGTARPLANLNLDSVLETSGVQLTDADNGHAGRPQRATVGSGAAPEVLRWTRGLNDDELVMPPNPKASPFDDLLAVGRGEAAMTMHFSFDVKDVSNALAQGQAPGFRMGVAPIPSLNGPARSRFFSASFLLSNGPSLASRAGAWTFLDWFEAPSQQAQWHRTSMYFPTRLSAASDPAVTAMWNARPELAAAWKALTSDAWSTTPFVGPHGRLSQDFLPTLEETLGQGAAPEEALARATAAADRHLAEYNAEPSAYTRWLVDFPGAAS